MAENEPGLRALLALLPAARYLGLRRADCVAGHMEQGPGRATRLDHLRRSKGRPRVCAARPAARGPAPIYSGGVAGPGARRDAGRDRVRGACFSWAGVSELYVAFGGCVDAGVLTGSGRGHCIIARSG